MKFPHIFDVYKVTKKLFRMKYLYSFIILALLSANVFAQSAVNIKDPKAKNILDNISQKLESYKSVEMAFDLILEFPGMEPEIQKGKIIQSGDKYFLDMQIQSVYCDGESLWMHMKNNNEVQWNNVEVAEEGGFMDPQSLLNLYKSGDYAYVISNEGVEEGVKIQQIEFKSLDSDVPYSKMRLTISSNQQEIKRMKIFSKDGSQFTLKISSILTDSNYPSETFIFDKSKFPGVHVEDLRI